MQPPSLSGSKIFGQKEFVGDFFSVRPYGKPKTNFGQLNMFISPKVKSICSHSVFFCLCNPWQPLINSLSVFPILDFSHIWNLIMVCPLCLACFTLKAAQSCPILCHPVDYTVHGILQARILEWVAVPFSRGSSQPGDQTQVSHISGGFFTS